MHFGVLGPLDAVSGGHRVVLGGPKQRELLAMLVLHANQVVPAGRLVEALWGPEPPVRAEVTLRSHVQHLRRRLAAARAVPRDHRQAGGRANPGPRVDR